MENFQLVMNFRPNFDMLCIDFSLWNYTLKKRAFSKIGPYSHIFIYWTTFSLLKRQRHKVPFLTMQLLLTTTNCKFSIWISKNLFSYIHLKFMSKSIKLRYTIYKFYCYCNLCSFYNEYL